MMWKSPVDYLQLTGDKSVSRMIVKGLDKLPELLHLRVFVRQKIRVIVCFMFGIRSFDEFKDLRFGHPRHPRTPVCLLESRLDCRRRYPGIQLRRIKAAVGYRGGEILDE